MVSLTSSIFRPWYFMMALGETYNIGSLPRMYNLLVQGLGIFLQIVICHVGHLSRCQITRFCNLEPNSDLDFDQLVGIPLIDLLEVTQVLLCHLELLLVGTYFASYMGILQNIRDVH